MIYGVYHRDGENMCGSKLQFWVQKCGHDWYFNAFREEWKRKIHRDGDKKITDNIGLCSKHFVAEDFVTESSSSNARGNRKRKGQKLDKPYLKADAIPTIFPNCPEHLTKDRQPRQPANATAETRNETAEKRNGRGTERERGG